MVERRLIVKICGITRPEDGMAVLEAGADWLGVVRWPRSTRFRPLEDCARCVEALRRDAPRPFELVGVYVDAGLETIEAEAARLGLDRIQLHGGESPEFARSLSRPAIKVLKIKDAESIRAAEDFEGVDLIADTFDPALPGGTGRGYDYHWLRELTARRRVLIAGGLHAGNVGEVVRELRPWGVDVSSAVESAPGLKDHDKARAFIEAARAAERSLKP